MIFFTSDTHFHHANIIRYCKRPWLMPGDLDVRGQWISKEIAELRTLEMDEALMTNWNSVVGKDDTVYHLGDVVFANRPEIISKLVSRLNGNLVLIHGSHDNLKLWKNIPIEFKIPLLNLRLRKTVHGIDQYITACHCKMAIWEKKHYGAVHIYGHSHNTAPEELYDLSVDIGVDNPIWDWTPVSQDKLMSYFATKQKRLG